MFPCKHLSSEETHLLVLLNCCLFIEGLYPFPLPHLPEEVEQPPPRACQGTVVCVRLCVCVCPPPPPPHKEVKSPESVIARR